MKFRVTIETKKSDVQRIEGFETPFCYSGCLYQAMIHIDNILSALEPDSIREIWNDVIGKVGMMDVRLGYLYTQQERTAKQTLTGLWNQAKIQNLEVEIQEVMNTALEEQ